jgi:hypothetical protein
MNIGEFIAFTLLLIIVVMGFVLSIYLIRYKR